jgi:hypothetical protein
MNTEANQPPPVQARYRISEQDYVNAGRLYARLTPRLWLLAAVGLAVLLALIVWGPSRVRQAAAGGLLGGLLVAALIRWVVSPWLLRRHYRQYKTIQQEQTVTLQDWGLHITSVNGESRLAWDRMLKWRQSPDYVLIYIMPRLFHVVPAAVAAQGFDLARLKALLAQHLGPAV